MADTPSTRAPNPPAGQSTSQLLDELDALMQRMLALPVQEEGTEVEPELKETKKKEPQPEPIPVAKSVAPRSVNLVPVYSPAMTVQAPAVTNAAPVVIAGKIPAFWPAPTDAKKSALRDETAQQATAPSVPPPAGTHVLPMLLQRPKVPSDKRGPLLPPVPPNASALLKKTAENSAPRTEPVPAPRPVWLQTTAPTAPVSPPGGVLGWLQAINAPFDACTIILGGLGRWLRGEQGRAIIGLSGLIMIAAATIWAVILFRG